MLHRLCEFNDGIGVFLFSALARPVAAWSTNRAILSFVFATGGISSPSWRWRSESNTDSLNLSSTATQSLPTFR